MIDVLMMIMKTMFMNTSIFLHAKQDYVGRDAVLGCEGTSRRNYFVLGSFTW
jgi:hypothetical protein